MDSSFLIIRSCNSFGRSRRERHLLIYAGDFLNLSAISTCVYPNSSLNRWNIKAHSYSVKRFPSFLIICSMYRSSRLIVGGRFNAFTKGISAPSEMAIIVARNLRSPSTSLYFSSPFSSLKAITVKGFSTPFALICSFNSSRSKSLRTLKPSSTTMFRGSIRNTSVFFVALFFILLIVLLVKLTWFLSCCYSLSQLAAIHLTYFRITPEVLTFATMPIVTHRYQSILCYLPETLPAHHRKTYHHTLFPGYGLFHLYATGNMRIALRPDFLSTLHFYSYLLRNFPQLHLKCGITPFGSS